MHHSHLRDALRLASFHPFRLHLTNGRTFDVPSPDWMIVYNLVTHVGVPGQAGDGEVLTVIDNWHITHLEPLPTAPA